MIKRITNYQFLFAFLVALLLGYSIQAVSAQGPGPTDDEVNRIAKKLFCPVCQNTPLDVCPTEACRQWREQIREMLVEGKTEDEIIDYFAVTYGERSTGDPRDKLKAYLIPVVAILVGTILLASALRVWRKPTATKPASSVTARIATAGSGLNETRQDLQDEYIAKMEEELKKRK